MNNIFLHLVRAGVLALATATAGAAAMAQPPSPSPSQLAAPSGNAAVSKATLAQPDVYAARAQERARLDQQRQAIDTALQQAEAVCYQRFAVQDCLNRERRRARQATVPLAQQQVALDEAERRERAALRRSELAERQQTPSLPGLDGPNRVRSPDAAPDVLQQERAYEAQQRAQQLQERQQKRAADLAEQMPQRAAAADKARQRLEEKRQAAERRRARALEAQQKRAAAGHRPPAALDPLP